jgi:hypothetical protein
MEGPTPASIGRLLPEGADDDGLAPQARDNLLEMVGYSTDRRAGGYLEAHRGIKGKGRRSPR